MPLTYRADHVGSLLRPAELLAARHDPETTADQLAALEDRHILRALARQKEAGLGIFTDGEFRRGGFMSGFYDSVEGLNNQADIARAWKGSASAGKISSVGIAGVVVERIRQTRRLTRTEVDFLKRHSPGDIKIT